MVPLQVAIQKQTSFTVRAPVHDSCFCCVLSTPHIPSEICRLSSSSNSSSPLQKVMFSLLFRRSFSSSAHWLRTLGTIWMLWVLNPSHPVYSQSHYCVFDPQKLHILFYSSVHLSFRETRSLGYMPHRLYSEIPGIFLTFFNLDWMNAFYLHTCHIVIWFRRAFLNSVWRACLQRIIIWKYMHFESAMVSIFLESISHCICLLDWRTNNFADLSIWERLVCETLKGYSTQNNKTSWDSLIWKCYSVLVLDFLNLNLNQLP
jgi:hypothetical protein